MKKDWNKHIAKHNKEFNTEAKKIIDAFNIECVNKNISTTAAYNKLWNEKFADKLNKLLEKKNIEYKKLWDEFHNPQGNRRTVVCDGKPTILSKIKKGEFFRFPHHKTVYVYDGKLTRGYFHYHKFDDTNAIKQTKTDHKIIVGFTF